jgi:hypothetical protein
MKKYRVTQDAYILLAERKAGDVLEMSDWDYNYYKKVVEPVDAEKTTATETATETIISNAENISDDTANAKTTSRYKINNFNNNPTMEE